MKNKKIILALVVLLLPIISRLLWFYQGIYISKKRGIDLDYESITIPQPDFSTIPVLDVADSDTEAVILIDDAHHNHFNLAEIEPLTSNLSQRGSEILIAESREEFNLSVKKADSLIIISPSDSYSDNEIEEIEEFIARGGRMVVITDPTRPDTEYIKSREAALITANQLVQSFVLSFNNDYIYNLNKNEGNFRNVYLYPNKSSELTLDLTSVVLYGAHSIESTTDLPIIGDEDTLSSLTDMGSGISAVALDESGQVLAIGDLTFMTNPFHLIADNYQFINNIASFLMRADRTKNLLDFPNLFSNNLAISLTEGIKLDNDLLAVIVDIQESFTLDDIDVTIGDDLSGDFDTIILGIYPLEGELLSITEDLGFIYPNKINRVITTPIPDEEITDETASVTINNNNYILLPEFGSIPKEEFGFILVNDNDDTMQLILLADSQDNCINLLKLVEAGSLDGCLVGKNVAICEQDLEIDLTNYFVIETAPELEDMEGDLGTEELEDEPTPEPSPTP